MIAIQPATINDALVLSKLGKKTFAQFFGHLYRDPNDVIEYLDGSFNLEKIKSSIAKTKNRYWLAYREQKAVGYAKIQVGTPTEFISEKNVCKLQRIYILKEHLADGIGTQLHQILLEKACELNCKYIWLSVLKSNVKATRFYERNDYTIVGEHPFVIGKEHFDFWVMAKKLKPLLQDI